MQEPCLRFVVCRDQLKIFPKLLDESTEYEQLCRTSGFPFQWKEPWKCGMITEACMSYQISSVNAHKPNSGSNHALPFPSALNSELPKPLDSSTLEHRLQIHPPLGSTPWLE